MMGPLLPLMRMLMVWVVMWWVWGRASEVVEGVSGFLSTPLHPDPTLPVAHPLVPLQL